MSDETILEEAARLVYGPRQDDYGHPFDDFSRTGRIWGALLADWAKTGETVVPPDLVGLCLIGVKLSREVNAPKRDNLVDAAGYAGTVALIRERQSGKIAKDMPAEGVKCMACSTLGPPVGRPCTICGTTRTGAVTRCDDVEWSCVGEECGEQCGGPARWILVEDVDPSKTFGVKPEWGGQAWCDEHVGQR